MQLARCTSLPKSNPISTVVESASCSRGWVRLLVQCIFAVFTIASFVLIVIMTVWSARPKTPPINEVPPSGCSLHGSRVTCKNVPFFGQHEGEISLALKEADLHSKNIVLSLDTPMFSNNTMPPKWLSTLRTDIYELNIYHGNLMRIAPNAFMSQFSGSIEVLVFNDLVIRNWATESFVGLSSLRELFVQDSLIVSTPRDLLQAVDDTLESLSIARCGHWNPSNITGSTSFSKLTKVDFSCNDFRDVLGQKSFTGLQKCKELYLNSCKITSIGAGAFDKLESIELLYLNNNFLVTIPNGLFKNIIPMNDPKPRINLQENLWQCDCSNKDLRHLFNLDMLITDPECKLPVENDLITFGEFEAHCANRDVANPMPASEISWNSTQNPNYTTGYVVNTIDDITGFIYMNNGCMTENTTEARSSGLRMISPVYGHSCNNQNFGIQTLSTFTSSFKTKRVQINKMKVTLDDKWIKFSYFLKTLNYSMLQIGSSGLKNYALVWYQSSCPNEIYCVNDVPSVFRLYNVDLNANYIFCPVRTRSGKVDNDSCVTYDHKLIDIDDASKMVNIIFFVSTGLISLLFGALCIYLLILKFPNLLKGSKRILFVKHKTVDALVLPPKVPLRNDVESGSLTCSKRNKELVISANRFSSSNFKRNKSTRSSVSNTPSYISALQPTEEQLAQWRIQHYTDNDLSITSINSGKISTVSWIYSDTILHCSLNFDSDTCESLK